MKRELTREFKKKDTQSNGTISVTQWCEVMKAVTGLDLPWRTMKPKLVRGDAAEPSKVGESK